MFTHHITVEIECVAVI